MIKEVRRLELREHITLIYDEETPSFLGIKLGDYVENFTQEDVNKIKSFVTTAASKIKDADFKLKNSKLLEWQKQND
tara:strand:+ start:906 stop:1136 length:231 start_codon:yes stop_codon:yes gene_type:complete